MEINYRVYCSNDYFDFEYWDSLSVEDENSIDSVIDEFMEDFCLADPDYYEDFLRDAFSNYYKKPAGRFSRGEIEDVLKNSAIKFLNGLGKNTQINVDFYNQDEEIFCKRIADIRDELLRQLEYEMEDGAFDCKISSYIEENLMSFVNNGVWHVRKGKNSPYEIVLCFGPENTCVDSCWIIKAEEGLKFWFEDDPWYIMKDIGLDENLLTWYLAECDCWCPDISEIRKMCPIVINENDNTETIIAKIKELGDRVL